jgi:hypothetical protein
MKPGISEFSYGYAITSEVAQLSALRMIGAPVFPSLLQEGNVGYDVQLPMAGDPVFFQFKLSDYMVRRSAAGAGLLGVPHYRMHLRPLRHSSQHNLLLSLEDRGFTVFYAAPEFHQPHELNSAYLRKSVVRSSAFFRPRAIGTLPDDGDHFVSFAAGAPFGVRFSDPVLVKRESNDAIEDSIKSSRPSQRFGDRPADVAIRNIALELKEQWIQRVAPRERDERYGSLDELSAERSAAEYLGWLALTLYDSYVFLQLRRRGDGQ